MERHAACVRQDGQLLASLGEATVLHLGNAPGGKDAHGSDALQTSSRRAKRAVDDGQRDFLFGCKCDSHQPGSRGLENYMAKSGKERIIPPSRSSSR
jgi:hypothetical protein